MVRTFFFASESQNENNITLFPLFQILTERLLTLQLTMALMPLTAQVNPLTLAAVWESDE